MIFSWIRRPSTTPATSHRRGVRRAGRLRTVRFRATLTLLEDRALMATNTWTGTGDWSTTAHWSLGHLPTSTEDVFISNGSTVTHSTGSDTIKSLLSGSTATVVLSGGTITDPTTFDVPGTFELQGGTLSKATVTSDTTITGTGSGGTLNAITLQGTLDATQNLNGAQDYAYVTGGLTLDGAANLGSASGGTYGQLYLEGSQTLSGTGTVTFGSSTGNRLNALGNNGPATLTVASGISIKGGSGIIGGYYGSDSAVFDGPITVAGGQTLTIQGANWVNAGTITAAGATVNLGGSFTTAAVGKFSATGAAVNLTGTLNNAGKTLALSPSIGAWRLLGGTIAGGTITNTGGSVLALTGSGGNLTGGVTIAAGATLDATQNLNGAQDYAYVTGGLTLDGAANLGSASGGTYGQLYLEGSQTLSGTGTVTFGSSTGNRLNALGNNGPATLTVASGISIKGGSGIIGGYYGSDSAVFDGPITVAGGQTLTIQGANWVNAGTITAAGATVNLGGSFTTAAVGKFSATGAAVNLTGTLNNAGKTLALSPSIGAWRLLGGTIAGGTITNTGGSVLALTGSGGNLTGGVTIAAGATLDATQNLNGAQDYAYVTGGLTLDGAANLGSASGGTYGQLYLEGSQTLSGTGTVTFGSSTGNRLNALGNNGPATLTVASGISIKGGSGIIGGYYGSDSAVFDGPITVAGGQTLTIQGANWVNAGTITAAGATVNLGGSFTTAAVGKFSATGAAVNLTGTLNNAGKTLALSPSIGAWRLLGGTIAGGTITNTGGSVLALTGSGGNLTGGVTIAAGATLDATQNLNGAQDYAYVTGGLTLDGAANLGSASGGTYGQLYLEGSQTLSGTGTVTFGSSTGNRLNALGNNGPATLTVASGISIKGGSGIIGGYYGSDSAVFDGPITVASGQTLTIQGANWVNAGTITSNAATVDLGGFFTLAGLGTYHRTGGTVNLTGTLNNAATTLLLNTTTGSWNLLGGTVNGGVVKATAGTALVGTGSSGTLNGVTLDGSGGNASPLDMRTNVSLVYVSGGLTLSGATLFLGNAAGTTYGELLPIGAAETIDGISGHPGTITLGLSGSNGLFNEGLLGPLTLGANLTIHGTAGQISMGSQAFDNKGTITADPTVLGTAAGTITLNGTNWTNDGTIQVQHGDTIIAGGTISNFSANTLTRGTWKVFAGSTLQLNTNNPSNNLILNNLNTNAATLVLDGANSKVINANTNADALTGFASNLAGGSLTVQDGRTLTTPAFTNAGTLLVGTGGTISMTSGANYTQTGGTTTIIGVLKSAGTGNFNLNAGKLLGTGTATFTGVINSGGQVNPGLTPQAGKLTITGNYSQNAGGTLNIRINGTAAGQFDQLAVSGVATLGGKLQVALNCCPGAGNSFQFMTFGSRSGTSDFATKNLPTLGGGLTMTEHTNATNALLTVSSPATTTVTNVSATTPNGAYGVGATITITVCFSRVVTVTGTPHLALNSGGTASYTGGNGTSTLTFTYVVGAGQNSGDLDYTSTTALTLNGGSITDSQGKAASLALAAPGAATSLGANKNIVIDTTASTVTNVTSPTANGTYGVGAKITITITFSEVVTVTGTPLLALNSGGTASYTGGNGTSTLTFTYVVGAGQNSGDLDYTSTTALTLNGGTIKDIAGNAAKLTLASPGAAGSLGANKNIIIKT